MKPGVPLRTELAMQTGDAAALKTALRVLGAIIDQREPLPDDLAVLRWTLAEPAEAMAPDELACEIINRLRCRVRAATV
jgi:hypothetical protein